MLTKISIKNFKRFDHVEFELGKSVVLIGPNNSGKSTALQALALWDLGLKRWLEKRGESSSAQERTGIAINRRDLLSIPVPTAKLLWRDLHVRNVTRQKGKPTTENIRIEIIVEGIHLAHEWSCGMEFDYQNEESLLCRPIKIKDEKPISKLDIPKGAAEVHLAFLPPMSGLAAVEPKWELGRINVLIGEGQTAQVLRNLCYQLSEKGDLKEWTSLDYCIYQLFGIHLNPPEFIRERGEITMSYRDEKNNMLDLSSSGRGLQQTLLLLAHLFTNPGTVLLLDEPDAHLEVLRQRQIYKILSDTASTQGSQIIAASHSEIVLNEAASRDMVIAFIGKPHRIDGQVNQLMKSLTDIGFEQYIQAEQKGWVIYLEGSTDLSILQAFAETLNHPANEFLSRPFVHYVTNLPSKAREHFYPLREARKDLLGIAIYDRIDKEIHENTPLVELSWRKKEIENYLCDEDALMAYAIEGIPNDMFGQIEIQRNTQAMKESIEEISKALQSLGRPSPWSDDIKASDEFLTPLFESYFKRIKLPNEMRKNSFYILAHLVKKEKIDPEITEKLNRIHELALSAKSKD